MNMNKEIVDLWFDQREEAKCRQLYPCTECPFYFHVSPWSGDMACKTIWLVIEKARSNKELAMAQSGKSE
jgi:hypothetical protein